MSLLNRSILFLLLYPASQVLASISRDHTATRPALTPCSKTCLPCVEANASSGLLPHAACLRSHHTSIPCSVYLHATTDQNSLASTSFLSMCCTIHQRSAVSTPFHHADRCGHHATHYTTPHCLALLPDDLTLLAYAMLPIK
jgi:hypothetical protein